MSTQGRMAVGHPVDVATGTMFNTWLDFSVPGIVPLSFHRFYSSALASRGARGPLGLGWRHGLQHELRQTVEGFAYVDPDGAETAIEDLDGEFGATGRLLVVRDQLELRGTADEVELAPYGPQPLTCWFKRRRGTTRYALQAVGRNQSHRLELQYDDQERLVRVVQKRSGRALALEHDAADRIAVVWFESQGQRELAVRFGYDDAGRLVTVRDRIGLVSRYEYDRAGLMLSEVHCLGAVHTFRYDPAGRCVYASGADRFEERQLTFYPREHRTEVADSHGQVTTYLYNDAGQVVETKDPLGQTQRFEYDGDGRMIAATDARGKSARMEYDRWGHLCLASFPDGTSFATTFDERHLPTSMRDFRGHVWRYEYDEQRQLLRSTNPAGRQWSYAYNVHGEVIRVSGPTGATAWLGWDRAGNPSAFRGADGGEWTKTFDHYGRCVAERDPAGAEMHYEFDRAGNLVRTVDPDGLVNRFEHDPARRTETHVAPDGARTVSVHNACGKIVEQWLPDGSVTRYEWDTEPGRLLAVVDGLGRSVRYGYDVGGRVVERRHWDGRLTRFEWDPVGNLTAVIDAAGGRTEYAYDDFGSVLKRTAADGAVTTYAHDDNGFATLVETADARIELERDEYGRILVERQNGVAVSSRYDAAGRRVELRSDLGAEVRYGWTPGGLCAAVELQGRAVRFEYDAAGREVGRELPGGWRFEQTRDACGRVLRQACLRPSGPVAPATAAGSRWTPVLTRELRYGPGGHVEAISDSLRGAVRFVHDRLGRLHAAIHGDERVECFGYDAAHNRTFAVRAAGPAVEPLVRALDRIGAVEPRELTPGEEVERVERGPGNAIVRLTRGAKTIRYAHDALGRLVEKHVDAPGVSEHWSYEWNASGQLVGLRRPDGGRWTYRYDGLGRRIAKIGPGGEQRTFLWDRSSLLHEQDAGSVTTWVDHPQAAAMLLRGRDGRVASVLTDVVGAPSEILDEAGELTWRARRGTWGEPAALDEGEPGFPGQQLDAESGLYYNAHRYYDPELGRYISPDPAGLLGGMNEYAYGPSPVEWADPLGLVSNAPVTGGPHAFAGTYLSSGAPDLFSPDSRKVTLPNNPHAYSVAAGKPPAELGGKGKTLSVVTGMQGGPQAFVSGHGKPEPIPQTEIFNVFGERTGKAGIVGGKGLTGGPCGNWNHAEIQALNWVHSNKGSIPPEGIHVYIDRACCPDCDDAVRAFLKHATPENGFTGPVTVHYGVPDPNDPKNPKFKKFC